MARSLKFWIEEIEGSYYLCSENKGADQLRSYREADLQLCFRIAKRWFSHDEAQIKTIDTLQYTVNRVSSSFKNGGHSANSTELSILCTF